MTVLHSLGTLASETPDAPLFRFHNAAGELSGTRTCAESWSAAERVAQRLVLLGIPPRSHVLLVYLPGLSFIDGFIGCLRAGLVPVPLPPPRPGGIEGFVQVARDCDARAVLTGAGLAESRGFRRAWTALQTHPGWTPIPWHNTDDLPPGQAELPALPGPEVVAFLQYTSGSTARPRGVQITYGNLDHQLENNRVELHFDPACVSVTWVPHYHDFLLISGILGSMAGHGLLVMIDPIGFLRQPALWGALIDAHRATHAWAPDFGYALFTHRTTPEERRSWCFASLRVLMTAAEPIRPATVDRFFMAFSESGVPPEAFCPAYGLAEHSVSVSVFGRERHRFSRRALEREGKLVLAAAGEPVSELFGCGRPGPGVRLRIVGPEALSAIPDGGVGEIWVDSPSKARGYLGHAEATAATFEATLEGEPGTWLRTGDLGGLFNGEVVVTGRLKDLLVLRGRNLAPQDAEAAVGASALFKTGRVIAFGFELDGEERLVVAAEVRQTEPDDAHLAACTTAAQSALKRELDVVAHVVVLCPPQALPKTTSGKVQRQACRKRWLAGELQQYGGSGGPA